MRSARGGSRVPRQAMSPRHRTRAMKVAKTQDGMCPACRPTAATTLVTVHVSGACSSARRSSVGMGSLQAHERERREATPAMRGAAVWWDAHAGQQQAKRIQLRFGGEDPAAELRQARLEVARLDLVELEYQ